jgi:hypothetical protein
MPNPMIPIYEALGGPWLLAAEIEKSFADDDDAAEQRADDDRYQRRYGDD